MSSDVVDFFSSPPSVAFWLTIVLDSSYDVIEYCYITTTLDETTFEPVNGFDVVTDPWGDKCSFTGMNLGSKPAGEGENYNGYIQGPDGFWYVLYDRDQLESAMDMDMDMDWDMEMDWDEEMDWDMDYDYDYDYDYSYDNDYDYDYDYDYSDDYNYDYDYDYSDDYSYEYEEYLEFYPFPADKDLSKFDRTFPMHYI
jgi:hypothetical protein